MRTARIVIDLGAMAHAIRRWLWKAFGRTATETQCIDCGRELTRDEAFHYICTCERCEGSLMADL